MEYNKNFEYNGILVYSEGNLLQTAFYEKVCEGRMLTSASNDISKSYITVANMLKKHLVKPNVFIASDGEDNFFKWQYYCSQPCFEKLKNSFYEIGLELRMFNIVEKPSLVNCICDDALDFSVGVLKKGLMI